MKTLFIALLLTSSSAMAVNKCVVDGKTIYQQSPCPGGTQVEMQRKGISSIGSESIREEVVTKQLQEQEAKDMAEDIQLRSIVKAGGPDALAAKEILRRKGVWNENDEVMEKLSQIEKDAKGARRNSVNAINAIGWSEFNRKRGK